MNSGDNYIGEYATSKVHDVSKEEGRVFLEHTSRSDTSLEVAALRRPERRLESDGKRPACKVLLRAQRSAALRETLAKVVLKVQLNKESDLCISDDSRFKVIVTSRLKRM